MNALTIAEVLADALEQGAHHPSAYCPELSVCYGIDPGPRPWGWTVMADTWSHRDGPDCVEVASGGNCYTLDEAVARALAVVYSLEADDRRANAQMDEALDHSDDLVDRYEGCPMCASGTRHAHLVADLEQVQ